MFGFTASLCCCGTHIAIVKNANTPLQASSEQTLMTSAKAAHTCLDLNWETEGSFQRNIHASYIATVVCMYAMWSSSAFGPGHNCIIIAYCSTARQPFLPSLALALSGCLAFSVLTFPKSLWARLQVSKDEEELQNARLKVTRGLPLQDLSGSRGFPDSPPQPQPQSSRRRQREE